MMKIIITVDTNDADYATSINNVTEKQLAALLPVIEAIKGFKPYQGTDPTWKYLHSSSWPCGENLPRTDLGEKSPVEIYAGILTEDQVELFENFAPSTGFYSVENIVVLEVAAENVLFP